ncbi:hypothetical protein FACS1894167_06710 [Synergistales bacterium]|nr:hypothetical protein FACS1894167_06710 [Synergistales bacterium]
MIYYSTLGHNLKRGLFNFCEKISGEFSRPTQKFILDMIYGLLTTHSCFLSEIARKLNGKATPDKAVERLSRNLMNFDGADKLHENYFNAVKRNFGDSTVLIIDDSGITKPCSRKLEGLCKVHDGSTGEIADGYCFAGVSALTAGRKQPIPVYSRVYSTVEKDYIGKNSETLKSLKFLSSHFPKTNIRALGRGYDAGYIFDYFIPRKESFIVRMRGDRHILFKGEKVKLRDLARKYKGKYALNFEAKDGKKRDCKISIVPVSLPNYPDEPLNLVICCGFGKEPLLLPANLASGGKRLCVTVVKVYLMRRRIEEYCKFKKQGFGFERFPVRSLKSIRNLDLR